MKSNSTINLLSNSDSEWVQPSIDKTYVSVLNERIIDGVYSATVEDEISVSFDNNQAWFWTYEWQAGEHKVDEYIAAGEINKFDSIDDMFDFLGK